MIRSKPKRQRNYKAEYQRRVDRGRAKGLSRSQSRGHPKAKEKNVRKPNCLYDPYGKLESMTKTWLLFMMMTIQLYRPMLQTPQFWER